MNQDFEQQHFNMSMASVFKQWQVEKTGQKRGFFLDQNNFSLGAKVFNHDLYYYDLTSVHLENPLGFNHPIAHQSANTECSENSIVAVGQIYNLLDQLFTDVFKINLNFCLIEAEDTIQNDPTYFFISDDFFRDENNKALLSKALVNEKRSLLIHLYNHKYIVGCSEVFPEISKYINENISRLHILNEKYLLLRLFLKSNLLEPGGKVSSINKQLERFASQNDFIEFKPMALNILDSSSILHDEIKQRGVLCQLFQNSITAFFPLTIDSLELDEVLGLIKVAIENNLSARKN